MTTHTQILWPHPKDQQVDVPCPEAVSSVTETLYPLREARLISLEKCLSKKSITKLVGDHRGEEITCVKGVLWITQSGNPDDIVIKSGESFTISQRGNILIQGLVESRFRIHRFDDVGRNAR